MSLQFYNYLIDLNKQNQLNFDYFTKPETSNISCNLLNKQMKYKYRLILTVTMQNSSQTKFN